LSDQRAFAFILLRRPFYGGEIVNKKLKSSGGENGKIDFAPDVLWNPAFGFCSSPKSD
jgi:hypothetical protein